MRYYEFARPSGLFNWVSNQSALTGFKIGFVLAQWSTLPDRINRC